jgi:4-hydroxybenzoate polyprenyltransferase
MTETAIARRSPPAPLLSRLLSCIRFDEVCALQGASLIGASLSIGALTEAKILAVAALVAGNLCLVAHVFVFNDWSGIHGDLKDPNRAHCTFVAKGVSRGEVGFLAMSLLALSLVIFGLAGSTVFVLAVAIASLSALYSAPALHMKGMPLGSSALHLVGGALHFLLGYAMFAPIDARAVAVSCFFGLVFTAGHFTHEARDREGDMLNGIRTNAVAFGKRQGFLAGLTLFTGAYALVVALAAFRLVPFVLVLAAALYPLHLLASLRALRAGLTYESLSQLQTIYRGLFAIIGVVMIVALWLPR